MTGRPPFDFSLVVTALLCAGADAAQQELMRQGYTIAPLVATRDMMVSAVAETSVSMDEADGAYAAMIDRAADDLVRLLSSD